MKHLFLFCIAAMCLYSSVAQTQQPLTAYMPHLKDIKGKLRFQYDGDKLDISLHALISDTSSFAQQLFANRAKGLTWKFSIGTVSHGGIKKNIVFSSFGETFESENNQLMYTVHFSSMAMVVNGHQAAEIKLWNCAPDSIELTVSEKEMIIYTLPIANTFKPRQAIWILSIQAQAGDTNTYQIGLQGSAKGYFAFNQYSLIEKDQTLYNAWGKMFNHLLLTFPTWFLWGFLYSSRRYILPINHRLYQSAIQWLPWLAGLYIVFFYNHLFAVMECSCLRSVAVPVPAIRLRIYGCIIAIALLIWLRYWKYGVTTNTIAILRMIGRTLSWSLLAYVVLGLLIWLTENYLFPNGAQHSPPMLPSLELSISAHLLPGTILLISIFIAFLVFQLFKFYWWLGIACVMLIIFMAWLEPTITPSDTINIDSFSIDDTERLTGIPGGLAIILLFIQADRPLRKSSAAIVMVLFPVLFCLMLPFMDTFLLVPITLIIAIPTSLFLIPTNKRTRLAIVQTANQVYELETRDPHFFRPLAALLNTEKIKAAFHKKFLKGDLFPKQYDQALQELTDCTQCKQADLIKRRLEFAPYRENDKNVILAIEFGAPIAIIAWFVYFKTAILYDRYGMPRRSERFISSGVDELLMHLFPPCMMIAACICLGYFYPYLKGKTGWAKGAWLGTGLGFAQLPYLYVSNPNPGYLPIAGVFLKYILILVLTGFLAFDLTTLRKIYKHQFSYQHIVDVIGNKKLLALYSFTVAAVGVGISSWISEHVQQWLGSLHH